METRTPEAEEPWLLAGDLPCLDCGYNLRGLVGPLVCCPECGRANDLRVPELWRRDALPFGVRQREHWPANSVLQSLVLGIVGGLTWAAVASGGWLSLHVAILLTGTVSILYLWVRTACAWVLSARSPRWALGVLAAVHASAWLALLSPAVAYLADSGPLVVILFALGVAGLLVAKAAIGRADRGSAFREDWRKWQLPLDHAPSKPSLDAYAAPGGILTPCGSSTATAPTPPRSSRSSTTRS